MNYFNIFHKLCLYLESTGGGSNRYTFSLKTTNLQFHSIAYMVYCIIYIIRVGSSKNNFKKVEKIRKKRKFSVMKSVYFAIQYMHIYIIIIFFRIVVLHVKRIKCVCCISVYIPFQSRSVCECRCLAKLVFCM